MKWTVYISAILLLCNTQSVIAQHIDLSHNGLRASDKNMKESVNVSISHNNGKTLWIVQTMSDKDYVCQKIFSDSYTPYDVSYSELGQIYHFSTDKCSLVLQRTENNQMSIGYDLAETFLPSTFSYGDSISGLFHGIGTYCDKLNIRTCGQYSLSADAYGDLLTAEGDTINNVMRIHTRRLRHTELMPFTKQPSAYGVFTDDSIQTCLANDSMLIEENYYRWYAHGYRYPILEQYNAHNSRNSICNYSLYYPPLQQQLLDLDDINLEPRNAFAEKKTMTDGAFDGNGSKSIDYKCDMNGDAYDDSAL